MKTRTRPTHSRVQKYLDVGRTIRERIGRGLYPVGRRLPTEVELARDLQVNPLTVSRALRELVREGLIFRRRGDGSYVSDGRHLPFLPGRQVSLGVLWRNSVVPARLHAHFAGEITQGALEAFKLFDAEPRWPATREDETTRALWQQPLRGLSVEVLGEAWKREDRHPGLEAVRAGAFDGLLCVGISDDDFIGRLLELGVPVVLVDYPNDRYSDRADQVFADPGPGYREAVGHFAAQGLKRIHYVGCLQRVTGGAAGDAEWRGFPLRIDPDSHLRQSAWRQAMSAAGLLVHESWSHLAWFDQSYNTALAARLAGLPADERPEAVICHSAEHAQELTEAFARQGLRLAGAGGADHNVASPVLPIRVDARAMGSLAGQLLHWRLLQPNRAVMRSGVAMRFGAAEPAVPQTGA